MAISGLHTLTDDQYTTLRYWVIRQLENSRPEPYTDSARQHHPTIGIGFNLDDGDVRGSVFEAMRITDDRLIARLEAVIQNQAIRRLSTKEQRDRELQRQLEEAYGQRL